MTYTSIIGCGAIGYRHLQSLLDQSDHKIIIIDNAHRLKVLEKTSKLDSKLSQRNV